MPNHEFSLEEREIFYNIVMGRRDVRGQFLDTPIEDEKLVRILKAAHHAPSVGFMQPWNFILISSKTQKKKVHDLFTAANKEAADMFEGEQKELYSSLKLQGILESPLNICVTCDRSRGGKVVLGRTHNRDTDLYSTVCAIQNLWLAARAEGIGVGWVSIFRDETLQKILALPEHVVPVAYLCLGSVSHFKDSPELEKKGWRNRLALKDLIMFEAWEGRDNAHPVITKIKDKP